MPMSSGGRAASSSRCATRPKVEEIGLTGYAVPTQCSLLTGPYVMATAERREPCESRGSCPVLGARGGETPLRDSTSTVIGRRLRHVRYYLSSGAKADIAALDGGYLRHPRSPATPAVVMARWSLFTPSGSAAPFLSQ